MELFTGFYQKYLTCNEGWCGRHFDTEVTSGNWEGKWKRGYLGPSFPSNAAEEVISYVADSKELRDEMNNNSSSKDTQWKLVDWVFCVAWGDTISLEIHRRGRHLKCSLTRDKWVHVCDWWMAYQICLRFINSIWLNLKLYFIFRKWGCHCEIWEKNLWIRGSIG